MDTIHFFQRFSQAENVATNNTLLLMSRLYQYSPFKFKAFIGELVEDSKMQVGVEFKQQQKGEHTVPDGCISQDSFKIVIETKLHKGFSIEQLIGHCETFKNEDTKILLSLCPNQISSSLISDIQSEVNKYNKKKDIHIRHIHTTFERVIECCKNALDNSDFEFMQIVEDYQEYCLYDGLIHNSDNWMRAVACGATIEDNFKYSLYYDPADRGYSEHGYIGIYNNKSVRGIGKIINIVTADLVNDRLKILDSESEVTDQQTKNIINAMKSGKENWGWDIDKGHKFFIVDKFYETDFRKTTKYPLQGRKFFNLKELLEVKKLPEIDVIAERLKHLSW
ncbi:MAG: hypothetical protein ACM3UU_01375 [Ignavibacteriales bacterium]